uniref:hypothetical protein n=1 Tax=Edaphosphingomonas laterariae TaxID=861865 RepID=UPI001FE8226C|nr:hypothetical protein [Sphingomonas laterariae]
MAKHPKRAGLMAAGVGSIAVAAALAAPAMFGVADQAVAAVPVPPMSLGINLAQPNYYSADRALMNLAKGAGWASQRPGVRGWQKFDPAQLDGAGRIKMLLPEERGNLALVPPEGAFGDKPTRIRCTWQGRGSLSVGGAGRASSNGGRSMEFDWAPANGPKAHTAWVTLSQVDPADPVRDLDCREKGASPTALFSPAYLRSLTGYKLLRFMDWQSTNINAPIDWANRPTPETQSQASKQGASVELMVALANEAGADPWFAMPWNADEDFQRRFATYVRDNLAPGRTVYVEMGNEVWNWAFRVTTQAKEEGMAAGLAPGNIGEAMLRRYAEKSTWMHKIWADVFKATPNRLVRVISTQNANPWSARVVLDYKDTAQNFDALATAPYFGGDTFTGDRVAQTDLDAAFRFMSADVDAALAKAAENKTLAARYGKRYLAYEAGQHVTSKDTALIAGTNRDPRMYDLYLKYMQGWQAQIGDTMMLYNSVGPISHFGAWGLSEYSGQPEADAPKQRAVSDFMRGLGGGEARAAN